MKTEEQTIVFFDGVCNFCNKTVDFLIRNNPKKDLKYSSLQSDFAQTELAKHQIKSIDLNSIYILKDGKVSDKSTAALKLIPHLKWFYFPLYSMWIFPKSIRDWGYMFIAKRRYKLMGKKDSCRIPTQEEQAYFIA